MNYLGKINYIIQETPTDKIVAIGDFNANTGSKYYDELSVWCDELNLIMSDIHILGRDSSAFAYVSDAHNTCSWLDHVVCSHSMHQYFTDLKILVK